MRRSRFFVFFFNDTATTEIYTLSLHDALPISWHGEGLILSNEELIAIADQRDRCWRPGGHDTEVNVERGPNGRRQQAEQIRAASATVIRHNILRSRPRAEREPRCARAIVVEDRVDSSLQLVVRVGR